jgi:hypothetical protein
MLGVTVPAACAAAAEWHELQPRLTKSAAPEEPEPVAVVVVGDEPPVVDVIPPVAGVVPPGVPPDKVTPIPIRPFIPLAACPGVWERNSNVPFFVKVTVSVADWPGLRVLVLSPKHEFATVVPVGSVQTRNRCGSLPRLVTLKVTVEGSSADFESVNPYSLGLPAVTVTTVPFGFPDAPTAA